MKNLLVLWLLLPCAVLADVAPSRQSVERLLILTDVKVLVDRMHIEVAGVARGLMNAALKGSNLSADEQRLVEEALKKIISDSTTSITWEKMCDAYAPLYQEAFSQQEIDDLIAFYESPAGKAFMIKMPSVTKEAALTIRERLVPVMTSIKTATEEHAAKVKAGIGHPAGS